MANKKKNWILIVLGVVIFVVILVVVAVVGFGYYMYRQMEVTRTNQASVSDFEQARAQFEGQQPYIELRDAESGEAVVHHELEKAERTPLTKLRVVVYDNDKKQLVRLSIPFWLVRLGGNRPIKLNQGGFDPGVRMTITPEDLERRGRGLVLDTRGRHGERVIVWAE